MWRSLKNFIYSLWTYADLSPDLATRRRVNRRLRDRPLLSSADWHETYWRSLGVSKAVAEFAYVRLQEYSGLEWGRVRPGDRLHQDLHLPLVCWFDWQTALCQDFLDNFDIELEHCFDPDAFTNVEELVVFLNQRLLSRNHS